MLLPLNESPLIGPALLDEMRDLGDPVADHFISLHFQSPASKSQLMQWLNSLNANEQISKYPDFFTGPCKSNLQRMIELPVWADEQKLKFAREFFTKHARWIMNLLGLLSLPYCYAAAEGAKVLAFSQRLMKTPEKRLGETAEFVWQMMDTSAFEPEGMGLVSLLKVRLIHAAIRYHLKKEPSWPPGKIPVNQEDMAGTNLSFSLIILRGLRKIGVQVSRKDQESYIHCWSVIGFMLGLDTRLIPSKIGDTIRLEKWIRTRNFEASDHGQELMRALLAYLKSIPQPNARINVSVQNWMTDLVGADNADILGLQRESPSGLPLRWLSVFNQLGISSWENKESTYYQQYKAFRGQISESQPFSAANDRPSDFTLPATLRPLQF